MAVSPIVRPMCCIFGTLGLIQGLLFFISALIAVLVHLCVITVSPDDTLTYFIPLMVGLYFQGTGCAVYNATELNDVTPELQLVTPEWLFIWMAVYVGVFIFWFISSLTIMLDCVYEKKMELFCLPFWSLLAIGNCAMDLTLAIYFGMDFSSLSAAASQVSIPALLPVVSFAMMLLSLKGLILWMLNLVGGCYVIYATWEFSKHRKEDKPLFLEQAGYLDRSPIKAFSPATRELRQELHLSNAAYARFSDLNSWPRIQLTSFSVISFISVCVRCRN